MSSQAQIARMAGARALSFVYSFNLAVFESTALVAMANSQVSVCVAALEAAGVRQPKMAFNNSCVPMARLLVGAGMSRVAAARWSVVAYLSGIRTPGLRKSLDSGSQFYLLAPGEEKLTAAFIQGRYTGAFKRGQA